MSKQYHLLFFNVSNVDACGIYQYGSRLFSILNQNGSENTKLTVEYHYLGTNLIDYQEIISRPRPIPFDACFYNHFWPLARWLTSETIQRNKPNFALDHENKTPSGIFDFTISQDPSFPNGLCRPLFEPLTPAMPTGHQIPVIGSFGLNYFQKGWDVLIQKVNAEFDEAIIRLHIPTAHYVGQEAANLSTHLVLSQVRKPGIQLIITHHIMTDQELLQFLASNDVNAFLYQPNEIDGPGRLSSVLDYALSVDRPICLSPSPSFKHVLSPESCVLHTPLKMIIQNGTTHLNRFRRKWSNHNLRERFYSLLVQACCASQPAPSASLFFS